MASRSSRSLISAVKVCSRSCRQPALLRLRAPAYTRPVVRPINAFSTVPSRLASSVSAPSAADPTPGEVEKLMVQGLECLAEADLEGARKAFQRSVDMKETPAALYNLALVLYQLADVPKSIEAFERSIALEPSADAHTNVASAYILSTPPNAAKAIEHLQKALALSPEDGEISFNMGVIFEASNRLEDALREYKRAEELGIERAAQCIRNVGGKLIEKEREAVLSSQQ